MLNIPKLQALSGKTEHEFMQQLNAVYSLMFQSVTKNAISENGKQFALELMHSIDEHRNEILAKNPNVFVD